MKRKLLLINDHFYPQNDVASLRMQAFAQYLDKDKFDVTVMTIGEHQPNEFFFGARVIRFSDSHWYGPCKFGRPTSWLQHKFKALWNRVLRLLTIEGNPGFWRHGRKALRETILNQKWDIVIGSFSSLASLRLAMEVKRQLPSCFFVADFRDEMSRNHDVNRWDFIRLLKWEKAILNAADLVTTVSRPLLEQFREIAGQSVRFAEIRNGYNFEPRRAPGLKNERLEILFAGTLYHYINLDFFYLALTRLQPDKRAKLRVKILGGNPTMAIPKSLQDLVTVLPKVPYQEIPNQLEAAGATLMVLPKSPRKGVYSGKIFDYLAVNRPILALVPPDDVAADLIRAANAGYVASNEDVESVIRLLNQLIEDWQTGRLPERKWDVVESHHRRHQVQKLQEILEKVPGSFCRSEASI